MYRCTAIVFEEHFHLWETINCREKAFVKVDQSRDELWSFQCETIEKNLLLFHSAPFILLYFSMCARFRSVLCLVKAMARSCVFGAFPLESLHLGWSQAKLFSQDDFHAREFEGLLPCFVSLVSNVSCGPASAFI